MNLIRSGVLRHLNTLLNYKQLIPFFSTIVGVQPPTSAPLPGIPLSYPKLLAGATSLESRSVVPHDNACVALAVSLVSCPMRPQALVEVLFSGPTLFGHATDAVSVGLDLVLGVICFSLRFGNPRACILEVTAPRIMKILPIFEIWHGLLHVWESIDETLPGIMQHFSHVFLVVVRFVENFHVRASICIEDVPFRGLLV